jgi:hypothetical protein
MVTILIIVLILCLVGGVGTSYGGWGGGAYRNGGFGGIGLAVILAIVVIYLLMGHTGGTVGP